MAAGLAPIPESFSSEEYATTQQPRPWAMWNLDSPSAQAAAVHATASSGANPNCAFRRGGLSSHLGASPQVCFLRPRTAQPPVLFSLMNSNEAAVEKFLPKSNLSRVILQDNLSAQRLCAMEIRASEKTKKKMGRLYDHLKKKFMTDQLRKLEHWKRESVNLQQYLDSTRAYKV
ncbi:hypothetical protein MC885_005060 [Smutsia gigantea]|nr:hypothetical protein MC885_005060 [Smutsia gigantea]